MIDDYEAEGYIFSDGVGMISECAAKELAVRLGLDYVPSVFQVCCWVRELCSNLKIRYAGFKGVIAKWPDNFRASFAKGVKILLRKRLNAPTFLIY